MAGGCQPSARRVHRKPGDTIVASVGRVQELAVGCYLYLRARVAFSATFGQGRNSLKCRQRSGPNIQIVSGNAATLLVGEVNDGQGWVEAEVARPQIFFSLQFERRVGSEVAGVFIESKLVNLVGSTVPDIVEVVEIGSYMRHESKLVGRVSLYEVGSGCGHQPFYGGSNSSAIFDAVYRGSPLVVVGQ